MMNENKSISKTHQRLRATLQRQQARPSEERHDERKFDYENSQHIDSERTKENIGWTYYDDEENQMNFEEAVLKFYNEFYGDTLKRINDNYVKDRHYDKQKTMSEYLENHRPEAEILQIGNVNDNVNGVRLAECLLDFMEWEEDWNEKHGRPFEILTTMFHFDEATPHIHRIKAWLAEDKHGNLIPNREKALEQAGVSLPNPEKKVSRYNNRNITFTKMCREKWLDICEEHGFDVIREPIKDVKHKNKGDFIREREKQMLEREENVLNTEIELDVQKHTQEYSVWSYVNTIEEQQLETEIEQNQREYSISSVDDEFEIKYKKRKKELEEQKEKIDDYSQKVEDYRKQVDDFNNRVINFRDETLSEREKLDKEKVEFTEQKQKELQQIDDTKRQLEKDKKRVNNNLEYLGEQYGLIERVKKELSEKSTKLDEREINLDEREKNLDERESQIQSSDTFKLKRAYSHAKSLKFPDGTTAYDYIMRQEQKHKENMEILSSKTFNQYMGRSKSKNHSYDFDI